MNSAILFLLIFAQGGQTPPAKDPRIVEWERQLEPLAARVREALEHPLTNSPGRVIQFFPLSLPILVLGHGGPHHVGIDFIVGGFFGDS